jgi:hypothetical protein
VVKNLAKNLVKNFRRFPRMTREARQIPGQPGSIPLQPGIVEKSGIGS